MIQFANNVPNLKGGKLLTISYNSTDTEATTLNVQIANPSSQGYAIVRILMLKQYLLI